MTNQEQSKQEHSSGVTFHWDRRASSGSVSAQTKELAMQAVDYAMTHLPPTASYEKYWVEVDGTLIYQSIQ